MRIETLDFDVREFGKLSNENLKEIVVKTNAMTAEDLDAILPGKEDAHKYLVEAAQNAYLDLMRRVEISGAGEPDENPPNIPMLAEPQEPPPEDGGKKRGRPAKQRFTNSVMRGILEGYGVTVKHNEITQEIDFFGTEKIGIPTQDAEIRLPSRIIDDYGNSYSQLGVSDIEREILAISFERKYNPVLELISGTKWDGVDRLPELYDIIGIGGEDGESRFSQTLFRKWTHQGISLLQNKYGYFGGDGVLVFQGKGGTGKTRFFEILSMNAAQSERAKRNCKWFLDGGKISNFDKDYERRVLRTWTAELGELEGTFKRSDCETLKQFITRGYDQYRITYAHSDTEVPRHTLLCATCNSADYLRDQTGNRKYWTVHIENIDCDRMEKKFDVLQFWVQRWEQCHNDLQGFRLTREEQALLEERNKEYLQSMDCETEFCDVIAELEANYKNIGERRQTLSDFISDVRMTAIGQSAFEKVSAAKLGKVLAKLGYERIRTNKGSCYVLPDLKNITRTHPPMSSKGR